MSEEVLDYRDRISTSVELQRGPGELTMDDKIRQGLGTCVAISTFTFGLFSRSGLDPDKYTHSLCQSLLHISQLGGTLASKISGCISAEKDIEAVYC